MDTDIPDAVRREALMRRLGEPEDVRRETSAGAMIGTGLTVAVVGVLISLAVQSANAHSATHLILPTGVLVLGGLALALRGAFVGTRAHHLFAEGLVARRRSGIGALRWDEVTAVETVHRRESGAVVGYRLRGDRAVITVPLKLAHGRDAFMDRVLARARAHGAAIR